MIKSVRLAALAAVATVVATPAFAVPVSNGPVTSTARVIKPLVLEKVGDMDFGTITVQDAGVATLDAVAGTVSCTGGLSCTGSTSSAEYKVKGTNNQTVQVTKPDVTLTNTDLSGTTLTLELAGPDTFQIPNSGTTGGNFKLGGEINVAANTREGTYVGDLAVTVEY